MSLEGGIVGLPNVGKSTLFNALTAVGVEAANYPFATIEPNMGVVKVPDERLTQINSVIETEEVIPAVVQIVDIAGLMRGASTGEGLGNQFLGHVRTVDAILEVVRCFEDPDVAHVDGSVDPIRDIETIATELALADLQVAERRLERLERSSRTGDREAIAERDMARRLVVHLAAGRAVRDAGLTGAEQAWVKQMGLLTALPILYVCNVDESGLTGNRHTARVEEWVNAHHAPKVIICAQAEAEIAELPLSERGEFLAELGLKEPGLSTLARATYRLLGLRTFFTAGPKEIRAWTIPAGATAPQAAGVIHTDFQAGFVRAEVYGVDDLIECGSEAALKAAGRLRVEGKDYEVADGDVVHFRFNV